MDAGGAILATRRQFIHSIMLASAAIAAPAFGRTISGIPWVPGLADRPAVPDPARTFFTAAERASVRAISARLIPSDDTGPGADEADVLAFRTGELTVVANTGSTAVPLPTGRVVVASGPLGDGTLPGDTAVWLAQD